MKLLIRITRLFGSANGCSSSETGTRLQNLTGSEGSSGRLVISVMLCVALSFPGALRSNPTEGTVRHGAVVIDDTLDGTLRILQESDKAILDWRSFSIGAGELTEFVQPGTMSAALNRVSGGQASQIDGQLKANGQVFLLNPAGIVIGATGRVDAAGFVASTLDVSDSEFLAGGDLSFRGNSTAAVVNLGAIGASDGDIFLIANRVENAGSLSAPNGEAGLAAGNDVLLTTAGDERIFVRGSSGGAEGVVNTGTIEANVAELKAHGGNVYAMAIRNEGRVVATGVTKRGGQIFLGSPGGQIANSGTLEVKSAPTDKVAITVDAGPAPGKIENSGTIDAGGGALVLLGHEIDLLAGSVVISDGPEVGGTITIGSAETLIVNVETGASVSAAGGTTGGSILVSGDSLVMDGAFSARGGENGGSISAAGREVSVGGIVDAGGGVNGGLIALSGVDFLTINGSVTAIGDSGIGGAITATSENALTLGATGVIDAGGGTDGGSILLDAGENGSGEIAGEVRAVGTDGVGGTVTILGSELNFAGSARVDASGGSGGGAIFAGGGRRGEDGSKRNSQNVTVAEGATFSADATTGGNGGEVIVFAEKALTFNGYVSATGGPDGGDGGFVELSGRETVTIPNFLGQVNVRSANGVGGTLLIDPDDIDILPGSGSGVGGTPTSANTLFAQDIATFVNGQSLIIETTGTTNPSEFGDITLAAGAIINVATANSLTLNASRDVVFETGSDLQLQGQFDSGNATNLSINAGRDISFNGTNVLVNDGTFDLNAVRSVSIVDSSLSITTGSLAIQNGPSIPTGDFNGITVKQSTISGSDGSMISLQGVGGSDVGTAGHVGIELEGSTISNVDSGNVTLVGTGGLSSSSAIGISLAGSTVSVVDGAIALTGTGDAATIGNNNDGVEIVSISNVLATGNGTISIVGTGGGTTDPSSGGNNGLVMLSNSVVETRGTGGISIDATGGGTLSSGGSSNGGFGLGDGNSVNSTSSGVGPDPGGSIMITGRSNSSGAGASGVILSGAIESASGDVSVTGEASQGDNLGIRFTNIGRVNASGLLTLSGSGSGTGEAIGNTGGGSNQIQGAEAVMLISNGGDIRFDGVFNTPDAFISTPAAGVDVELSNALNDFDRVTLGGASTDEVGHVTLVDTDTLSLVQTFGSTVGSLSVTATTTEVDGDYASRSGAITFNGDVRLNDATFTTNATGSGADFTVTGDLFPLLTGMISQDLTVTAGSGDVQFGGELGRVGSGLIGTLNVSGGNLSFADIDTDGEVNLSATGVITFGGDVSTGGAFSATAGEDVLATSVTLGLGGSSGSHKIEAGRSINFDDVAINFGDNSLLLDSDGGAGTLAKGLTLTNESEITGSGNVVIDGLGGTGLGTRHAVVISNSMIDLTGGGSLSITGVGGTGGGVGGSGVRIVDARLETQMGSITLDGTGSTPNAGVGLYLSNSTIQTTDGGAVTLTGDAPNTGAGSNQGVVFANGTYVSSTGDVISVTGTGGGAAVNNLDASGVSILGGSNFATFVGTTTGPGGVTIVGTSNSSGSAGVMIDGGVSVYTEDTLSITGSATTGDQDGIQLSGGSSLFSDGEVSLLGIGSGAGNAISMASGVGGIDGLISATLTSQGGDIEIGAEIGAPLIVVAHDLTSPDFRATLGPLEATDTLQINTQGGNDVISFTDASVALTPTLDINLSGGNDRVTFAAITSGPVSINIEEFDGVESITGSADGNDRLISGMGANDFVINDPETGTVNGMNFSAFENLDGAGGDDTFTFLDGGDVSGVVDGGSGFDTIHIDNSSTTSDNVYTINANSVVGSQYDFLNLGNVRISGGSGADTVNTNFFSGFTQDLNGGGGNDTLNFGSPPSNEASPFSSASGGDITATQFENFNGLTSAPGTGGPAASPNAQADSPPTFVNMGGPVIFVQPSPGAPLQPVFPMNADTGGILQLETDQSPATGDSIGGQGSEGNQIINQFNDPENGNGNIGPMQNDLGQAQLLVDVDGDGIDDNTGAALAADGQPLPSVADRTPGQPFIVVNPDGTVTFDGGPPPAPPTVNLLGENVAPEVESELRDALGQDPIAGVEEPDGTVAIDASGIVPDPNTETQLNGGLSPDAQTELQNAINN